MTTQSPSDAAQACPAAAPSAALQTETPAPWVVPAAAPAGGVEWLPRTRPHRGL